MAPAHLEKTARRVIAGTDENGKSAIVSDEVTHARVALPAFTVNDVWRIDTLPAKLNGDDDLGAEVELDPPAAGLVVRLATFPPDSEIDPEEYGASIDSLHGEDANSGDEVVMGLHKTDTVDVVTVVDGEVYAVLETGEVLLKAGDTIVNRGNTHAWSNRTDKPVTMLAVMVPAL